VSRFWKAGDPFVWLTGAALGLALLMVIGLVALITLSGLGLFWPSELRRFTLADGKTVLGQISQREVIPNQVPVVHRIQVQQGNRDPDLFQQDFVWIDEAAVAKRESPSDAVLLERREWGLLMGYVREVRDGGKTLAKGPEAWAKLREILPRELHVAERIRHLEKHDIGAVMYEQKKATLALRKLEMDGVLTGPAVDRHKAAQERRQKEFEDLDRKRQELRRSLTATVLMEVEGGKTKELPVAQIVRALRPNEMGFFGKVGTYAGRLWEFLWDDPRESNTEGGVFPAIFGTVMMVMIMSVFVTPLGVLAALYLREYAKQGPFVSAVRIAVNNLAGVPSIVFGVFGVGFFIYTVGGGIDRFFFSESLPTPTFGTGGILWASLTLALLTVPVVIVATEEGLAAIPKELRHGSLALGATKWETTWKVVLPSLMPSILTGLILAMARAAGEVAPLMLTGVSKLAPALPLDGYFPYVHLDRKFMHLGYHIYDVGFQSPNVDAARPMVYMTATLLLLIVVALNLVAIVLRKRLRAKFQGSVL
jgi:phosphate transport system permease protein